LREQAEPVLDDVRRFSVLNLARQFHYEPRHATQVAHLATQLFDQLAERHDDGAAERGLLWAAAQLHDIGMAIDYRAHERHSEYLLLNGGLDGYSHREIALLALLVRAHRSGGAGTTPYDALLKRGDAQRLKRLAALLRLAEYLERGRRQAVRDVQCQFERGTLTLHLRTSGEASVEAWDAGRNVDLLEKAFKCKVVIE
jgi:exopolyphosphatase/guanosine-5'-triphosphate,3'-diphosphate pyrophosphatase